MWIPFLVAVLLGLVLTARGPYLQHPHTQGTGPGPRSQPSAEAPGPQGGQTGQPQPQGVPGPASPTVGPVDATTYGRRWGRIETVDCARGTFMLHDGPQRYAYALTNATALYVGSTRLTGDCPLRRFVGSSALVWSAGEAHTTIAERVTIAPLPSKRP